MSATDAIVKLTEEALAEKEKALEDAAGPLASEVNDLKTALKKLTRGSSNNPSSAPTVAEDDLIAAVVHCSKSNGPASSKEIAKFLGIDTRNVARRLSAFAAEGKIAGNKDEGYTA